MEAGYLTRRRVGSRDFYELHPALPLPGKTSAPSRIVNVASSAQSNGRIDLKRRHEQASFNMNVYSNAKLANVMATYALARRLRGTGVTVNCLHPGVVATSFGKNSGGWVKSLSTLAAPFLLTPEKGARTSIHLASAPEVENFTGGYFVKSKPSKSSATSYDESLQELVWQTALHEVGASDPAKPSVVPSGKLGR